MVTRTITYTIVKLIFGEREEEYIVNGKTTVGKEMKKYLKNNQTNLPKIEVKEVIEKREMSLQKFIENSEIVGGNK